jgi:formate dehydrogenase major subunit/formate dehydrogenase alpha subunit
MILWGMGVSQHVHGTDNARCLIALALMTGQIGRPGTGLHPLRGQNNVQGACDMGGLPNTYPAYQPVTNPEVVARFSAAWGYAPAPKVGLTVTEMMPGLLDGRTHALYIMAEDPVMSDPDTTHIRHCLEAADFIVLQEIFPTETAVYADVLLPGVTFAEKDGTVTNTERRVQRVRKAIEPLGEARQDWQITAEIARRMLAARDVQLPQGSLSGWDYATPSDIMTEINVLTPSYAGITYERLERGERLQWPIPNLDHPGTPILHTRGFARGLGKFMPIDHIPPAERPDDDYPFVLSTGRVLYHWHGGEMTRRAESLMTLYSQALIEVNPLDAEKMALGAGADVRVTSRRGVIQAKAWVTDRVPPGMVYANFHFPEASANQLTQAVLDPVSKIPEFKVCAVRVEAVPAL